eukprot:TRINITY_DN31144_c0_g1_i2.p1 TRINITY_DN31144_c0_g1~~TRINITY_DN31144_c0_g1_i2.p1  ORF type:complete len:427 (-),score=83.36 TRINITY_DN31144_c0_g1_i2:242-1522(-)
METQMHAIPDTAVFRVGPFAPDGITDQQIKTLQAEIRAKWRREKFAAALNKVKASGKAPEAFSTGTKKSRLDLNDILTKGKQSGTTDMFRITQLLRLGHGDGKTLMKYRHPDPFLSNSNHKLPPSLEANVNAITHAVLSRLRQQHGGNTNSGSVDPIALSSTLQLASFNGGASAIPPNSFRGVGSGGVSVDDDSVKIGSPTAISSPSYLLGGSGVSGTRKAVSFQEMMRGLDEDKMEEALFDNKLRMCIIEEIVGRVEGERYGDVAQQPPVSPQGFSMNTIFQKSTSPPQQQISPPRYDEITAFSPTNHSPSGNTGRESPIFSHGYLQPPLAPSELDGGQMGIHHDVDRDIEAEDTAEMAKVEAVLFERRVPIPVEDDTTTTSPPQNHLHGTLDETAKPNNGGGEPSAAKKRFTGLLKKFKAGPSE